MTYVDLRYRYATTGEDIRRYANSNVSPLASGYLYQPQGWICPRCGKVWSPSMPCCTCKPSVTESASTVNYWFSDGDLEEMANDPDIKREMDAINKEFASADGDGLDLLP